MRVFSGRWKLMALLLCLLLVALVLTTVKTRLLPHTSLLESTIMSTVMPLQQALVGMRQKVRGVWDGYVNLIQVRSENMRLREQVQELQAALQRYQEAYLQQQRLRELLDFRTHAMPKTLVAEVVGLDPSLWSEVVVINKGHHHNVRTNMAVVTPRGLVGRTIEVAPYYASVLLITDRRSAVDALIQRSRARGIVVCTSRRLCKLRYVDVNEDVQVDDAVISSGLGQVYPKGLLIGTVTSVRQKPYSLFYEVDVQPAVNLAKIEEVLVLVP